MRLILVRHGESVGNAAGVLQGRLDYGLSERGLLQAKLTADRLQAEPLVRLISSPLKRAAETADFVASAAALPVEFDEALAEYDIGEGAGLTPAELRERFPELVRPRPHGERFAFPGEEGRDHFHQRLTDALARYQQLDGLTVAVAHGGVVSAICHLVVGLDLHRRGVFQVGNCSLTEVITDRSGRLMLARHNDMCHLEGLSTLADRG